MKRRIGFITRAARESYSGGGACARFSERFGDIGSMKHKEEENVKRHKEKMEQKEVK